MSKSATTRTTTIRNTTPWSSSFSKQPLQLNELKLPDYQNNSNFNQEHSFLFKSSFRSSYQPSSKTSQPQDSKKRTIKKGITSFGWESLKNTWSANENQPILEIVIVEKQCKNMQQGYDHMENQKRQIIKDQEGKGIKYFQGSSVCNLLADKTARNINSSSTQDSEKNDFRRSYESQLISNSLISQLPFSKPSNNSITQDSTLPSLLSDTKKKTRKSTAFLNPQAKMTSNRARFLSSAQALDFLKPSQEFSDQFLQTSRNSYQERIVSQAKNTLSLERIHKLSLTAATADEPSKFHRSSSDLKQSLKFTHNLPAQGQIESKQRSNFLVSSLVTLKSLSVSDPLASNNNILSQPSTYPKSNPILNNSVNATTSISQSLLPLRSVPSAKLNIQLNQSTSDSTQPSIQGNKIIISDKQLVQEESMESHSTHEDPYTKKNESQLIVNLNNAPKNPESISLPLPTATNLIQSKQLPNLFQSEVPPNQPQPSSSSSSLIHNYPLSLSMQLSKGIFQEILNHFISFANGFNKFYSRKTSLNCNNNQLLKNQHKQADKSPISLENKQLQTNQSGSNEHFFDSEEEDFFNYTQSIKQSRQSPSGEHCERINQICF